MSVEREMMTHYRIYNLLRKRDLLRPYSPRDVIEHLERIHKLRIGDEWKLSEVPKQTRSVMGSWRYLLCIMAGIRD